MQRSGYRPQYMQLEPSIMSTMPPSFPAQYEEQQSSSRDNSSCETSEMESSARETSARGNSACLSITQEAPATGASGLPSPWSWGAPSDADSALQYPSDARQETSAWGTSSALPSAWSRDAPSDVESTLPKQPAREAGDSVLPSAWVWAASSEADSAPPYPYNTAPARDAGASVLPSAWVWAAPSEAESALRYHPNTGVEAPAREVGGSPLQLTWSRAAPSDAGSALQYPAREAASSVVPSAWSWAAPSDAESAPPHFPQNIGHHPQNMQREARSEGAHTARHLPFDIPTLPLGAIAADSEGFAEALRGLTRAIVASADAFGSARSESSTTSGSVLSYRMAKRVDQPPEPAQTSFSGAHSAVAFQPTSISDYQQEYGAQVDQEDAEQQGGDAEGCPLERFELFFDAPYDEVDHARFVASLIQQLRARGFQDMDLAQMTIALERGMFVHIEAPPGVVNRLRLAPLRGMKVEGCAAHLSLQEMHSKHGPAGTESLAHMLRELGGEGMQRPTASEIQAMAARIADMRRMTETQEEQVKGMLIEIADAMFGDMRESSVAPSTLQWSGRRESSRGAPSTLFAIPEAASAASEPRIIAGARRPSPADIQRMAASIGQRCGEKQVPAVQAMLRVMTEVLFGPEGPGSAAPQMAEVPRPSPRTCEEIIQRVIERSGGTARHGPVRHMLTGLTEAMFGERVVAESEYGSLHTARSSRSSAGEAPQAEERQVEEHEVYGLLTELCGVLFEA